MDKDGKKVLCALAYPLWLPIAIINLIIADKDKELKKHGAQGLVFGIVIIIAAIALSIISVILGFIPVIGWLLIMILWPVFYIGTLVLAILYAIKAFKLEKFEIPVVTGLTKKIFKI